MAATGCWCRRATRSSWPRRCARCGSTRYAGARWASQRGSGAGTSAGRGSRTGHVGLRARDRGARAGRPRRRAARQGRSVQGDLTPSPRRGGCRRSSPAPPTGLRPRARMAGARRVGAGVSAIVGLLLRSSRCGASASTTSSPRSCTRARSGCWSRSALFSTSMFLRALSWFQIVRAALPGPPVKRRTILSATSIGVLMSATLPARLGEPSRALIVARRIGRMRESLPVVAGTLVSQTLAEPACAVPARAWSWSAQRHPARARGRAALVSVLPVGLAPRCWSCLADGASRRVGFGGGRARSPA